MLFARGMSGPIRDEWLSVEQDLDIGLRGLLQCLVSYSIDLSSIYQVIPTRHTDALQPFKQFRSFRKRVLGMLYLGLWQQELLTAPQDYLCYMVISKLLLGWVLDEYVACMIYQPRTLLLFCSNATVLQ